MPGVKVRLVNLYLPEQGQPEKVDVLPGLAFGDQLATLEPIHTLGLGESTDYFEPPATDDKSTAAMAFFPEGKRTDDDKLIQYQDSMAPNAQWTVVMTRGDSLDNDSKPSMGYHNLDDKSGPGGQMNVPEPAAGKGQIVGHAGALINVLWQDDNSFTFGIPGKGCLTHTDENLSLNVGGTSAVPFDVDPGTVQLAAYDAVDVECSGDPEIGPVDVEVVEGKRTYVLVFTRSEDPDGRELLVLPTD